MHFIVAVDTLHAKFFRRRVLFQLAVDIVLVLILFAIPAAAQNAAVSGQVLDSSSALVPGAQIMLTNDQTNTLQRAKTNESGIYNFSFVRPGTYTLVAEASGFRQYRETNVTVETAQNLELDIKLQVGGTNESITVNGSGIGMNTTDASVSTVIDAQFVANMPLNGRSFQDLISLTPGVITTSPNEDSAVGVTGDFSINGQRTESNSYIVDGVSANFSGGNGSAQGNAAGDVPAVTALGTSQALVSIDDLQEFRVLSSSYSAEYGRAAGGQISFVTRSGTNDLHGTLFEYLRNDFFDANNWFNDYLGQPEPPLRQSDFGGTFGAPVRIPKLYNGKDRTFFFVSYEGLRLIQPQAATVQSVPDLNLRANSAAAIQPILNAFPLPNLGIEQTRPCSGTTFSNTTPYPCPSGSATGTQVPSGLAEYSRSYSLPSTINATSIRLDENITSKMSVFFRFADTPSDVESRQRGYSIVTGFHSDTLTYSTGITNQLSTNVNNSLRLGYGRNSMLNNGYLDSFGGATPIDFTDAAGASGPNPEPDIVLNIPGTITSAFFITGNHYQSSQWNFVDTVSITKGHHQLKFGFDFRRLSSVVGAYDPLVDGVFANAWQIQNNLPGTFLISIAQPGEPLFKEWALFAQNEWRVAPRFSLSLGLRWDVDGPPTSANGQGAYTLSGSLGSPSTLALAPRGTPLWNTPYLNFAPRLGIAYEVRTNPGWETVVRAGGGVFFDTDDWLGIGPYQGFGFGGSHTCPALTCGFPATPAELAAAAPKTAAPYSNTYDYPSHMQLPYSLQWNLSVQQALGTAQSLTLSYVGASTRRLPDNLYYSLASLNANIGSVVSAWGDIHSNYNALQASFQRKLSHGVQVLASYTWSHSLDNLSEGVATNIGQRESLPQYGNSDFDLRQNFVAGVSRDLPSVNHDSITKAAFSHWGLDARFTDQTGFPVQVMGPSEIDPATGQQYYSGVSLIPGQSLYLYGADCTAYYIANGNPNKGGGCPGGRAVNPLAFSSTGSLSNPAPKNIARGFGENQINLAIRREFPIWENLKLQFRAESYNILNHPNFGSITGTVGSSNFGLATATLNNSLGTVSSLYQQGGSRSMQFALKLIF